MKRILLCVSLSMPKRQAITLCPVAIPLSAINAASKNPKTEKLNDRETHVLRSSIMTSSVVLNVHLPESYKQDKRKIPGGFTCGWVFGRLLAYRQL